MPFSLHRFPETRWTLVAALQEPAERASALEALCRAYWRPICAVMRHYPLMGDAEDLTQEFLMMVLRNELFTRADRQEGKLRSWLLTSLRYFLHNRRRIMQAEKRGAGAVLVSIDEAVPESALAARDDAALLAFDRGWAETLVGQTVTALRQQYEAAGRGKIFEAMLPWLLLDGEPGAQSSAAEQCGLSIANFRVQLHRLRGRYRDELRQQVAATTSTEVEMRDELRHLIQVLSKN